MAWRRRTFEIWSNYSDYGEDFSLNETGFSNWRGMRIVEAGCNYRLRFGNAVLCQSFRNPALLAKMAATLQFMSGGRFILGLGAGWHEEEYQAYGYEFPSAPVRVEQLEEAIQIIQIMWREETATFQGRHYQVAEARCEPRPDPIPPIMVGAFKPKMLRLAAKYADWWNVSSTSLAR